VKRIAKDVTHTLTHKSAKRGAGVFRIETKKDLRMAGRAIRENWNYDRQEVIAALMELVINRDPDLMLGAIERLQKGDEIAIKNEEAAIKRELMEIKKLGDEQQLRVRLLELARHIEPAELARLASQDGIANPKPS
jgi:hypothetical protein